MKNLFLTIISIFCLKQGFGQDFSVLPKSGVLAPGETVFVSGSPQDTFICVWGVDPYNVANQIIVVGSGTLVVPDIDTIPIISKVRTTVENTSELRHPYTAYELNVAISDSIFNLIPKVDKKNVLWVMKVECVGMDTTCLKIRHYNPTLNDGGYDVSFTCLPQDLVGDTGMIVPGVGYPYGQNAWSVSFNSDNTLDITDTLVETRITLQVDTSKLAITSPGIYTWQGASESICTTPHLWGCPNISFMEVNTVDSTLVTVDVGSVDTLKAPLESIDNIDGEYKIVCVIEDIFGINDTSFRTPNWDRLTDFNILDLFPELDKWVIWKMAWVTIMHENVAVYQGWARVRVAGGWSVYHIGKNFRIVFLSGKWYYPPYSERPLDAIESRKFGSGKAWTAQSDMFANEVFYQDSLSVPGGEIANLWINGEYMGNTNLREPLGKDFVSDRFDVKKKNVETSYKLEVNGSIMPKDEHRDSIQPRQLEYMIFLDWLKNADKNSPSFLSILNKEFHSKSFFKSSFACGYSHVSDRNDQNQMSWKTKDLPYRQMLKDSDGAFGWGVHVNTLHDQLHDPNAQNGLNYILFNQLIQSDTLEAMYYNVIADMLSTTLLTSRLLDILDTTYSKIVPSVTKNHERYEHFLGVTGMIEGDSSRSYMQYQIMRDFILQRRNIVLAMIDTMYDLDTVSVHMSVIGANHSQELRVSDVFASDSLGFDRLSFNKTLTRVFADPFGFDYMIVDTNSLLMDTIWENQTYMEFDSGATYAITAYYNFQLDPNYHDIILNEVLTKNDSIMIDGKYPDIIELKNIGEDTVDVGGLYVSDKLDNLTKFQITESILVPPGGFVLLIADGKPERGPHHTNFKLDSDQEGVYISIDSVTAHDSTSWNDMPVDISSGLCDDNWEQQIPSPSLANNCGIILGVNFIDFIVTPQYEQVSIALEAQFGETPDESIVVYRSLDGVNADSIGVMTNATFEDTTVAFNILYYYQLVSSNDSSDVKSGILLGTGISELQAPLFPNPSNGNITIPEGFEIQFKNTIGQSILIGESGEHVALSPGLYFYTFHDQKSKTYLGSSKILIK